MQTLFLRKNSCCILRAVISEEAVILIAFLVTVVSFFGLFVFFVQNYRNNHIAIHKEQVKLLDAKGLLFDNKVYKLIIDIKSEKSREISRIDLLLATYSVECSHREFIKISDDIYGCVSPLNFKSARVTYNGSLYSFYVYVDEDGELTLLEKINQGSVVQQVLFKSLAPCSEMTQRSLCCFVKEIINGNNPLYHYVISRPIIALQKLSDNAYRIYVLMYPIQLNYIKSISIKIYYNNEKTVIILKQYKRVNNIIKMVVNNG